MRYWKNSSQLVLCCVSVVWADQQSKINEKHCGEFNDIWDTGYLSSNIVSSFLLCLILDYKLVVLPLDVYIFSDVKV